MSHRDLRSTARHGTPACRSTRSRGVTLIECLGASIILAVIAVAAVRASAGAAMSQVLSARQVTATMLAESLIAEIERKAYVDPTNPSSLTRDAGESPTDKTTFDDADDYDGWSESPPQDPRGAAIPGLEAWSRTVSVGWSARGPLTPDVSGNTGLKVVTVSVYFRSKLISQLQSLRAPD